MILRATYGERSLRIEPCKALGADSGFDLRIDGVLKECACDVEILKADAVVILHIGGSLKELEWTEVPHGDDA